MTAQKVVEAVHYILSRIKKANKLKLVKLLYLADKYHLLKYGRTITEDDYYAMHYGPVGSVAKDILTMDEMNMTDKEYRMVMSLIKKTGKHEYAIKDKKCEYETLSESDQEVLDYIVEKFGSLRVDDLIHYTHQYPEWQRHEDDLNSGEKRKPINPEELLSVMQEDPFFKFSDEHIKTAREILREHLCFAFR